MTSLSDRLRTQTVSDDETHEVFTLFHEAADKIDQLVEGLSEAVEALRLADQCICRLAGSQCEEEEVRIAVMAIRSAGAKAVGIKHATHHNAPDLSGGEVERLLGEALEKRLVEALRYARNLIGPDEIIGNYILDTRNAFG